MEKQIQWWFIAFVPTLAFHQTDFKILFFFSKLQPWSWWFEVPGSTIVNTFVSYTMWSLRSWQRSKYYQFFHERTLKCFTRKRRCFHWCVRSKPLESYFLLWRSEGICKEDSHQGAVSFPRVGTYRIRIAFSQVLCTKAQKTIQTGNISTLTRPPVHWP